MWCGGGITLKQLAAIATPGESYGLDYSEESVAFRSSPRPQAGCTLVLITEVYKGANTTAAKLPEKCRALVGLTLLTPEEHRVLLVR